MIAAIYCPGPSLRWHVANPFEFMRPRDYDVTWAVNTALKLVDADWFAAGDITLFRGLVGPHRPRLGCFTMAATRDQMQSDPGWANLRWRIWSDAPLIDAHERSGRPINWSLQSALCHAVALGVRHVDLYGCDLAGTTDATGYVGEDRSADRWARERSDLDYTIALLAPHGLTVRRITPP
jgi:hypothetical protein